MRNVVVTSAATAIVQEKASILIAIDANNNVWINRRQVDLRSVRSIVERLHAENPKGLGQRINSLAK